MAQQYIITGDANQVLQYNYDDYFKMQMYDGDIYKTRNLRNQLLMQQYPTDSLLRHAQDSIENGLASFDKQLWVLTAEEKAALEEAEAGTDTDGEGDDAKTESVKDKKRSVKKSTKQEVKSDSNKESKSSARSSRSGAKAKKPDHFLRLNNRSCVEMRILAQLLLVGVYLIGLRLT